MRRTPAAPAFVNRILDVNKTHTVISRQDVAFWTNPECGHTREMWELTMPGKTFFLSSVAYSAGSPGGAGRQCRPSLSVLGGEGEGRESHDPSLF